MDIDTPNSDALEYYVKLCRESGAEPCLEVIAAITAPSRSCSLSDRVTPLKDVDAKCIAGMLKEYHVFDILNVEGNEIEQDGILSMAGMMKKNSSIHTLRLGDNRFRDGGVITLAHVLQVNSTLTSLDLSHNRIGGVGCKALSQVLKTSNVLQELVLHGNVVDGLAAQVLTSVLSTNRILKHLHLGDNDLGSKGAIALAGLLRNNTSLLTLDVSNNRIPDIEGSEVLSAIGKDCALQRLNMRNNLLADKAFNALAAVLPGSRLREVFLGYNNPAAAATQQVISAAAQSKYLTLLDVHGLQLNNVGCICKLVTQNSSFECLLLDAITAATPEDANRQASQWNVALKERRGLESFHNWPSIFVGKEADRTYSSDNGPLFMVGDVIVKQGTATQAGGDDGGGYKAESIAIDPSPSPAIPKEHIVPSELPRPEVDTEKEALMIQVQKLELRLEIERSEHSSQIRSFEERLRSLETDHRSRTSGAASVMSLNPPPVPIGQKSTNSSYEFFDLNESNITLPQQMPVDKPPTHPGRDGGYRDRDGNHSIKYKSESQHRRDSESQKSKGIPPLPLPPTQLSNDVLWSSVAGGHRVPSRSGSGSGSRSRSLSPRAPLYPTVLPSGVPPLAVPAPVPTPVPPAAVPTPIIEKRSVSPSTRRLISPRAPRNRDSVCVKSRFPMAEPYLQSLFDRDREAPTTSYISPICTESRPSPKQVTSTVVTTTTTTRTTSQSSVPLGSKGNYDLLNPNTTRAQPVTREGSTGPPPLPPPLPLSLNSGNKGNNTSNYIYNNNNTVNGEYQSTNIGQTVVVEEESQRGSKPPPVPMSSAAHSAAPQIGRSGSGNVSDHTEPRLNEPIKRGRSPCPQPAQRTMIGGSVCDVASPPKRGGGPAWNALTHQNFIGRVSPPRGFVQHDRAPSPAPVRAASHSAQPPDKTIPLLRDEISSQSRGIGSSPKRSTRARRPTRSPRPVKPGAPIVSVPPLQDSLNQRSPPRRPRGSSSSSVRFG